MVHQLIVEDFAIVPLGRWRCREVHDRARQYLGCAAGEERCSYVLIRNRFTLRQAQRHPGHLRVAMGYHPSKTRKKVLTGEALRAVDSVLNCAKQPVCHLLLGYIGRHESGTRL